MDEYHDILRELKEFEERTSISASAVCRKATGNPRMYERLVRRIEQTQEQVSAIRAEMSRAEARGNAA
jgi:ferritin-like metal-binding protein YciE